MFVHYYGIRNCVQEEAEGRPVLTDTSGYEPETLRKAGFHQLTDGRWVHELTEWEIAHIQATPAGEEPVFGSVSPQQDAKQGGWGWYIGVLGCTIGMFYFKWFGQSLVPAAICGLGTILCAVIALVRYPANRTAKKTVSAVISALGLVYLILIVIAAVALIRFCDECGKGTYCRVPG